MLRGTMGKKAPHPLAIIGAQARAPVTSDRIAPSRPGETTSRRSGRPWDGDPGSAACNFAVSHLSRDLSVALQADGDTHAETCLAAIGAIAGYAAQHALLFRLKEVGSAATLRQLQTVRTITGGEYFFGETLNRTLMPVSQADAEGKLWSVAAGAAIAAGLPPSQLPNTERMFANMVDSLGGELEGMPFVPERHLPKRPAKQLVIEVWPTAMMCFMGRFPHEPRQFGVAATKFWPAIAAHVAGALIR
jgi:hypothetical protein